MADDNKAQIVLDGDVSPFRQKLREATADLKKFGADGETAFTRMTGPLGALHSKFLAIGALLAGGKVFGDAVRESQKLTGEANMLAKTFAISTTEASYLNVALGDIYSSADDFTGAATHLSRQMRTNESDLTAMGVKTREANGEYRNMKDIMFSALDVLRGYKEGTDRNLAAQAMFGRGAADVTKLLKLQAPVMEEARKKAESLGLVIGVQNVEASKEYKAAMNDVGDIMTALQKVIGDAVMPVLTQMGSWFAEVGPAAVVVFKGLIGGLISLFWGLKFVGEAAWNFIAYEIEITTVKVLRFADAAMHAMKFDFDGARAAWDRGTQQIEDIAAKRLKNVMDSAEKTREKLFNLFDTPDASPGEKPKGNDYVDPSAKAGAKDSGKEKAEASFMHAYETRLAAVKNAYEAENLLREYSKEQELAYWRLLRDNLELTAKDRLAIDKKTATLELEIRRKAAKDQHELDGVMIDHRRADALAQIAYEEQVANQARDNGELTKRQLLVFEEDFARRRFEIEYQAAMDRLELLKTDPTNTPAALQQVKEQMLEIERQYQLKRSELQQTKKKEDNKLGAVWEDAGNAFGAMANNLLTRATTLRQQLAGVFQGIYQSFITNLVSKPLGEWVASQARMLAVKMGFLTASEGADKAAAAITVATKGEETGVVVAGNAAQAGSEAAKATAGIPVIGPAMAMASMAAIFAAVMALTSKKSARGGYDIPKGLNPMTQLHEEEMVLPQKYANVIRGFATDGVGGAGAGGDTHHHHYHIQAWDSRDVGRFLQENKRHVAGAVKSASRDGFKA